MVEVADDGRGIDPEKVKRKAYEKGLITEDQLGAIGEVRRPSTWFSGPVSRSLPN